MVNKIIRIVKSEDIFPHAEGIGARHDLLAGFMVALYLIDN